MQSYIKFKFNQLCMYFYVNHYDSYNKDLHRNTYNVDWIWIWCNFATSYNNFMIRISTESWHFVLSNLRSFDICCQAKFNDLKPIESGYLIKYSTSKWVDNVTESIMKKIVKIFKIYIFKNIIFISCSFFNFHSQLSKFAF